MLRGVGGCLPGWLESPLELLCVFPECWERGGMWEPQKCLGSVHWSARWSPTCMFSLENKMRTCSLDNDEYKYYIGENPRNSERKWLWGSDSLSLHNQPLHPFSGDVTFESLSLALGRILHLWNGRTGVLGSRGWCEDEMRWSTDQDLMNVPSFPRRTGWLDQVNHHLGKGLTMLMNM